MTDLHPPEEISLASAFAGLDLHDVKTDQVPFTGDRDLACCGDVLIPDDAAKARDVKKFFLAPVVAEAPAGSPDPSLVAAISPSSITVEVENGSGQPGLGARVAAALRAQGFTVSSVTNADSFAHGATEIHVHSLDRPLAGERVHLALPAAVVTPDAVSIGTGATKVSDVTVIVGRDYAQSDQREASTTK